MTTSVTVDSLPFDHEKVVLVTGERSRLPIIVAVHSTALGQALGGARMWSYPHWTDALADALRLAEGMTFKNAAAGLARGGGKSVVCIPEGTVLTDDEKRNAMLDLADVVESLGGSYMTAEDVGTSAELMSVVSQRTAHVCGLPPEEGGAGEPADATAAGVHASVLATLEHVFGTRELSERHLVISGLGQVGGRLARTLAAAGARLTVSDVVESKRVFADEIGAAWVQPSEAHRVEADAFIPCGLGGILSESSIPELRVRAVVGAANNQLAHHEDAERLREHGIVWAPDFVVNAGGVIYLDMASTPGVDQATIEARVSHIGDTVAQVLRDAEAQSITTLEAAERLAQARLAAA